MGKLKYKAKKKRLVKQFKIRSPPFWAHMKKYGLKRIRTRRIRVNREKKWNRGGKLKK